MAEPLDPTVQQRVTETRVREAKRVLAAHGEVVEVRQDIKTSAELREVLLGELIALVRGRSEPKKAAAVARLASAVVETVRMEIEVAKHRASHKAEKMTTPGALDAPLRLGSE